jgi:flagellar L-ring protein precursor FlgH
MKPTIKGLLSFFIFMSLFGCASLWPEEAPPVKVQGPQSKVPVMDQTTDDLVRFSENPNIGSFNDRRYRRVTRKSLEEESDVGSHAGSLWNTEGPSSYLFTQNKLHREGDLLTVKLEGNAKTQVDTKIQVLKKLLARLEIVAPVPDSGAGAPLAGDMQGRRDPASASTEAVPTASGSGTAMNKTNSTTGSATAVPVGSPKSGEPEPELDAPINVDSISTRVTERLADGNYRVKGQQSFMIGKKEFRVIVTGLVRPEDFSDEGLSSNKLLDPQLDVVSLRRSLK